MRKIKSFFLTSLLGGLTLILPVAIIWIVFSWIFKKITTLINPLTDLLIHQLGLPSFWADLIVISIILFFCFLVGLFERTQLGKFIYQFIEQFLLKRIPGYNLVKETLLYFLGDNLRLFSSVALVQLFGNETLATAFITDEHADGSFTVFVPTGPNPTSGLIYHLPGKYVHRVKYSMEQTLRTIISCGAGSKGLLQKYQQDQQLKSEKIS